MSAQSIGWKAESKTGVVAASGAEAVSAEISILARDGNAADAAVATPPATRRPGGTPPSCKGFLQWQTPL